MSLAARVGSAYVLVRPSLKGFQAEAARDAKRAGAAAGTSAGGVMGKNMARGAAAGLTADIPQLRRAASAAATAVQSEAAKFSLARDRQTAASSRLAIAEQKLVELRARGTASQSAMMAAESRVVAAKAATARATDAATAAQGRYVAAMKSSTGAQAALSSAMQAAATAAAAQGKSAGSRFLAGLISALKPATPAAAREGTAAGAGFVTGVVTGVRAGGARVVGAVTSMFRSTAAGATAAGRTAGAGFMGGILAGLGPLAALLAPAAILGGGFKRLADMEDARAQLVNLGHTGERLEEIMDSALSSVEGTSYALNDAAGLAANAAAAGIEPGEALTRQLTLAADAAAQAKVDLGEMGQVMGKVWAAGRVSASDLNSLQERQIPIWNKLAEHYNITQEELRKMVSAGEVDLETFSTVMEDTVGGAALAMGNTTRGVFRNIGSAGSRLGVAILEDGFPMFKRAGEGIIAVLDAMADSVGVVVSWVQKNASWLGPLATGLAIATGGLWAFRAAFWALNVVMRANPVMMLVTAVGALIGGLILAYRHFEPFRKAVDGLWRVLQGGSTGMLANALDIPQDHAGIRALRGIHTLVTEGIPAGFRLVRDLAVGVFNVFTEQGTGLLANTLGVSQDHWIIGFLQDVRLGAIGLFDYILNVAVPAIGAFVDQFAAGQGAGGAFRDVLTSIWTAATTTFGWIRDEAIPVLMSLGGYIVGTLWPDIQDAFLNRIWPAMVEVGRVIKSTWESVIRPSLSALWTFVRDTLAPFLVSFYQDGIKPTFDLIGQVISWTWRNVIRPVFEAWVTAGVGLADKSDVMRATLKSIWDRVTSIVETAWGQVRRVLNNMKDGLSSLGDRFSTVRDGISRAWGSLARIVGTPIRATIMWVNDNFLARIEKTLNDIPGVSGIKLGRIPLPSLPATTTDASSRNAGRTGGSTRQTSAAMGGVLPGPYSPGVDNMHFYSPEHGWLHLAGGEPVMRPEFGRAVGTGWVDAMNAAARTGGVNGVRRAMTMATVHGEQTFARGGVVVDSSGGAAVGGGGGGLIARGWDLVVEFVKDATGWVKNKVLGALSGIGDSYPAQAVAGSVNNLNFGAIGKWIMDKLSLGGGGGAGGGAGRVNYGGGYGQHPTGMHWSQIWSLIKAVVPNAIMTSNFRGGAMTASGIPSLHGLSRAVDWATPGMVGMIDAFRRVGAIMPWSQHFYTPAGRGSQHGFVDAAIARMHNDHGHTALERGGHVPAAHEYSSVARMLAAGPQVRDVGGPIPPGDTWVRNGTGHTEYVINPSLERTVSLDPRAMNALNAFVSAVSHPWEGTLEIDGRAAGRFVSKNEQRSNRFGIGAGAGGLRR